MGSPLGYSSDFFFVFFISLFSFIQPELLHYLSLVLLLSSAAFGIYLISNLYTTRIYSFILGILGILNPTIFYKYTAGHIDYFASYAIFVFLIYFLIAKFRGKLKHYIVLALILSFVGIQIQFFLIGGFLTLIYFVFYRSYFKWQYIPLIILMPICINFLWVSNFIIGASDVVSISNSAADAGFKASSATQLISIFTYTFSKATLLSRYFTDPELFLCSLITLFALYLFAIGHKKLHNLFVFVFMLIMMFFGTGLFQIFDIKPFNLIYPMFREVGHFAPIIVLCSLLIIGFQISYSKRTLKLLFIAVSIAISVVVSYKFMANAQELNISQIRGLFSEFKKNEASTKDDYRVLSYPFFGKYSFNDRAIPQINNLPISNAGHDSYSTFSNDNFLQSTISPSNFKSSIQYKLLKTYDVNLLSPYNVRYLYDFSNIYTSSYNNYVPNSTYEYDLSLIKNNPNFFKILLERNPGKIKKVSQNIYEIINYKQKVYTNDNLLDIPNEDEDEHQFIKENVKNNTYEYSSNALQVNTRVDAVFNKSRNLIQKNNPQQLKDKIDTSNSSNATIYRNTDPTNIKYVINDNLLTIYGYTPNVFSVNGTIQDTSNEQEIIVRTPLTKAVQYYITVDDRTYQVLPGLNNKDLGHINKNSVIKLYKSIGNNLINNPSFESGLWQNKVSDCNNYDKESLISMSLDNLTSSNGLKSLNLTSKRHIACTSKNFKLNANTNYLLKYDYRSPNMTSSSYYLNFNLKDDNSLKGTSTVNTANQWQSFTRSFMSPSNATFASLYLHADPELNKQKDANILYDNIIISQLDEIGSYNVNQKKSSYKTIPLKKKDNEFSYKSDEYLLNNIVSNGNFDNSLWQDKVSDCNKSDNSAVIGMNNILLSDKNRVLELNAKRHDACTYTTLNTEGGGTYILSFKYRGKLNSSYGYSLRFNDDNNIRDDAKSEITSSDKWQTVTYQFKTPPSSTITKLFLYSYETNGYVNNSIQYDDVSVVKIPDLDGKYYIVENYDNQTSRPSNISYSHIDQSTYSVSISNASKPFYLNLSESYNKKWKIISNNKIVLGEDLHYKVNDYSNGWYVDPKTLCKQTTINCKKLDNGSYNINVTIEFTPQNLFMKSEILAISITAIAIVTLILIKYREISR